MNNMLIALEITALGMGLVFGAIVLLWWMMNLLTWITAEKETTSSPSAGSPDVAEAVPMLENSLKAQAAAVAVTIALAEQKLSTAHLLTEPPTTIVSAWQLGMRTRQMYQKGNQTRKIG
jgi:Na+-transporting methylmalonyl-CoA/oxaloacetate decarboxylase gamma subunit